MVESLGKCNQDINLKLTRLSRSSFLFVWVWLAIDQSVVRIRLRRSRSPVLALIDRMIFDPARAEANGYRLTPDTIAAKKHRRGVVSRLQSL